MSDDFSLEQFTSVDTADGTSPYVEALEAFDNIDQLRELKALAWQRGGFKRGVRILDVGCGFGLETLRLAREVQGQGLVAGVDLSQEFIDIARQRASAESLDIDFRVADAASLPFDDAHFDCVRAERLLIYIEDVTAALGEMWRVLKTGGRVALIEPDFSTTTINVSNRALVRKVMAHEIDTAVVQSWLPGQLSGMLSGLNFSSIEMASRVLVFPKDLGASYFGNAGRHAAEAGTITSAELEEWLAAIAWLAEMETIFGNIGYFLFTAQT
jgi:SAM-dependent methyltransferase